MFFSKREVKIFLTFFVIYALFIHWAAWDEISSLALTRNVIDKSTLEIGTYINETGDRIIFDGKYYIAASPGLSFVAAPTYATLKFFITNSNLYQKGTNENFTYHAWGGNFITYTHPSNLTLFSMIFVVIFTSSIFGALSTVVLYKTLAFYTDSEKEKFLLIITFGFGTFFLFLSTMFLRNATAIFFILASFFLIKKNKSHMEMFLAGILLGFGIFIDYSVAIIGGFLFIYCLKFSKRFWKWFLAGMLLGALPLLAYNLMIFHNPIDFSLKYYDQNVWPQIRGYQKNVFINEIDFLYFSRILAELLIFSYRGLFFYFPVLAFAFMGLYFHWKKSKFEATIFILIFIAFIAANSLYFIWWGGTSFGPRYLSPAIPFLIILIEYFLKETRKNKTLFAIFLVAFVFSIFQSFTSLQSTEHPIIIFNYTSQQYQGTKQNNPIYDHYLPLTLKNGLRSRILEDIATNATNVDIRDFQLQPTSGIDFITTPLGFLTLKLQVLGLATMIIIVFIIWKNDLSKKIPKKYSKFLFAVPILVILMTLDLQTIHYSNNWYPIFKNETFTDTYRWTSNDGTLNIFSSEKHSYLLNFSFVSFNNQTFSMILNNKTIGTYYSNITNQITTLVNLNSDSNTLLLHSFEGCYVPIERNISNCLSIGITNLTIQNENDLENDRIIFGNNWYYAENTSNISYKWMLNNGSLFFVSKDSVFDLKLLVWSYHVSRTLIVSFENSTKELVIGTNVTEVNLKLKPSPSINEISFYSKETCNIPALVSASNDTRCLSFGVQIK